MFCLVVKANWFCPYNWTKHLVIEALSSCLDNQTNCLDNQTFCLVIKANWKKLICLDNRMFCLVMEAICSVIKFASITDFGYRGTTVSIFLHLFLFFWTWMSFCSEPFDVGAWISQTIGRRGQKTLKEIRII